MVTMTKFFKIGSQSWYVVDAPRLSDDGLRGKCYRDRGLIEIDPNLPADQYQVTLLHELLHACTKFVGIECEDKLTEEDFVTKLAPILHTMLIENGMWSPNHK